MADASAQVVVLVCCYNGRSHLPDLLASLTGSDDGDVDRRLVVVDNASTDDSSDYIRQHFPEVDCVRVEPNRGFTGGNNFGYAHVRDCYPQARYLVLLNVDTIVASGWLPPLVEAMERETHAVAAQPTIVLHPETGRINTIGNRSHYLGFGMMGGYGAACDTIQEGNEGAMDFPSGAAVMLRMTALEEVGLFDERFYMYLEDADLGWKLRQRGGVLRHVPESVVQHKYAPDAPAKYYRHLERNRWLLLLTYYKWRTLALLAPALLVMELGQCIYATTQGALRQKLASWCDLLRPAMWRAIKARRHTAQARRTISDRAFMARFVGRVHLPAGDPWALRWIANPLFNAYWRITRQLIRW